MIYKRANSDDEDFKKLAAQLEAELKMRDGEDHEYLAALNKIDFIPQVIIAYENEAAVGIGAIKIYDEESMELKRMFVPETQRGKGMATGILFELEKWMLELNYKKYLLETGINQPEAISFYQKNNYKRIKNFGKYKGENKSVCFEKMLKF